MGDHRETGAEIERSVMAGDDSYDLYAGHAIVSGGPAMNGIFLNWHNVENVDFTQPWWQQNSVEALTIDGVMPLVPSYMTMTVVSNTYCMFYNKEIAANYQLETFSTWSTAANGRLTSYRRRRATYIRT